MKVNTNIIPQLRFSQFDKNWEQKMIDEIGRVVGGGTPNTTKDEYWNGNINWFTPSEIKNKYSKVSLRKITDLGLRTSTKLLPIGTLLVTSRATIGQVSIAKNACSTNQGFQSIVVNENYCNEFLYYWLLYNKNALLRKANGSTFLEISGNEVGKLKVKIPGFEEQQKIASFLSSIDDWIENLTQQKLALEKYRKGMMQKLFSQELRFKNDKGSNFPAWEEKMLGDICEYKNGGSFENNIVENGTYNLITLNSIDIDGRLKSEHKKVSSADWYLEKGDLIMVLSDVAHGNFLGLVDVIPENNMFVLNQRMGLLRKKDNNVDLSFLRTYINFNQRYFKRYGQGSSQLNLSKGDVLKFKVKIPHLDEQKKISDMLETVEQMIAIKNSELLFTEEWKKGLMQKLFI